VRVRDRSASTLLTWSGPSDRFRGARRASPV